MFYEVFYAFEALLTVSYGFDYKKDLIGCNFNKKL
jgi:hypothetical protein